MGEQTNFDLLIIGAGQAGIPLAHALAKNGKASRPRGARASRWFLRKLWLYPNQGCDFLSTIGLLGTACGRIRLENPDRQD